MPEPAAAPAVADLVNAAAGRILDFARPLADAPADRTARARRLAAELLARQTRRLAAELRTLHPHVYDDAGQRTAEGVLRAAALLDLSATQLEAEVQP